MSAHETTAEKVDRQKWEAEGDLRSLVEVQRLRDDPPRMKRAMALIKKQLKELKSVQRG